ncbi:MAG: M81 family metallopeptidase [Litorilinea sp.]
MQEDYAKTKPRIVVGGIVHETHSFAEDVTGLDGFAQQSLWTGAALVQELGATRAAIGGMIAGAQAAQWEVVPTLYGAAMPSGTVADSAYTQMLDSLIAELAAAIAADGAVDGVLLALHGAMVTETILDPESHVLEAVRAVVDDRAGKATPIVVVLDMHGNISPRLVELASVLVAFDTNPHIDPYARGIEAVAILGDLLAGKVHPTAAIVQPPWIFAPQATGTDDLPLRAVHDRRREMEADADVVCISVMAGFAYADTPDTGPAMIVTTNDNPAKAAAYAQELADICMAQVAASRLEILTPAAAVQQAMLQTAGGARGPVMLVDSADNIGGGTPGDGTDALRAMLDAQVQEGTIVIADPEAVAICWQAGADSAVELTVGGKADRWHGEPVPVRGTVRALSNGEFACELPDNHFASFFGNTIKMGRTVWLRVDGVNIILTERKIPPFDLAQLRGVGVEPEAQSMIVVKSAVAYRAAYMPIAAGVLEMDTQGLCTANLARFPYQHARRPYDR